MATPGDSERTDRSHIVTGVVSEKAITAATATMRGHRPATTVATDAQSAAQHSTAVAACRSTYRSPLPPTILSASGTPGARTPAHSSTLVHRLRREGQEVD